MHTRLVGAQHQRLAEWRTAEGRIPQVTRQHAERKAPGMSHARAFPLEGLADPSARFVNPYRRARLHACDRGDMGQREGATASLPWPLEISVCEARFRSGKNVREN